MKTIAILLATYNSERYLEDLLNSILSQTMKDYSCYIHDDGSTDMTVQIINRYVEQYPDVFTVLHYEPKRSAKANFMSMLKFAHEPYVMFCDHDDVWVNKKVEISYKSIQKIEKKYPNQAVLVFSDMKVVSSNLTVIHNSFMRYTGLNPNNTKLEHLLVENVVPGCTSIMNCKLYEVANRLENYDHIRMHDVWCALIASAIGKVCYLDKPLNMYRQHGDNVKGAEREQSRFERAIAAAKKVTSGEYGKYYKDLVKEFSMQAYELSLIPGLTEEKKKLCRGFAELGTQSKVKRMKFFVSNHISREKDNWWMLIWI